MALVKSDVQYGRRISVDRCSPVPLYFQVAQRLEELIESGHLTPGTRLLNELALAEQLGLSRPTIRKAIEHLIDKGLLVRRRGVGTQVAHAQVRRRGELTSLYDDLQRTHRQPRTEVLSLRQETASGEVAVALAIPSGAPVLAISRLRYARGEPLALMRNYLPDGLIPLTAGDLRDSGLYQLMRAAGLTLRAADQTIGARRATTDEAEALRESCGAPVLTATRTTYDDTGRAVAYGQYAYRASTYHITVTSVAR